MSLSTTGTSALAIAWAISPPIVPAPTTAALNTNKLPSWIGCQGNRLRAPRGALTRFLRGLEPLGALPRGRLSALELGSKRRERAREGRPHLRAHEEDIGGPGEDPAVAQLVGHLLAELGPP